MCQPQCAFDFLVPVNALVGRVSIVGGLHASGVYDSHVGLSFLPMILRARECRESMISSNMCPPVSTSGSSNRLSATGRIVLEEVATDNLSY